MRLLILKDKKITKDKLDNLKAEFTDVVKTNTGLTPIFYELERDFTRVPTTADSDGDLKPSRLYMSQLMQEVHTLYGDWGIDSVVMLVHQDNWIFRGIWGTNWSNLYYTYHVHLVRFDRRNPINTLGTFYHEWMHCLDALIKTHTAVDINTFFKNTPCYVNWDSTVVHGNKFAGCKETPYTYIKWRDNEEVLKQIAPYLERAYRQRRDFYLEPYRQALLKAVALLKSILNRK